MTVDGTGSRWTNSEFLIVGFEGDGQLTITDGGFVSDTLGSLGNQSGVTGVGLVDGQGSEWRNTFDFQVGFMGTGELTIQNGGKVTNTGASSTIGSQFSSDGTVTVDGAGSQWTNSGELFVGDEGRGVMEIRNSGLVTNTRAWIGNQLDGVGRVTVDGTGSSWTNSEFVIIGFEGNGTLVIQNGGQVSDTLGSIGNQAGLLLSTAVVDGAGSTWTNTFDLQVGFLGRGRLIVRDGGLVTNTGASGTIGSGNGSNGFATVEGAGSTWSNAGILYVGEQGRGTLEVLDGGSVDSDSVQIGDGSTGNGTLVVDGAGSRLQIASTLDVADAGMGLFVIQNGGLATDTQGRVGSSLGGGTGLARVDGQGSAWTHAGLLEVGGGLGTGDLIIRNGGSVANTRGRIANGDFSTGTVTVTGLDSTWTNTTSLDVGFFGGAGSLTLEDSGRVVTTGTTTIHANGALTLNSGGTLTTEDLVIDGGLNWNHGTIHLTGLGGLTVGPGGALGPSPLLLINRTLDVTHTTTVEEDSQLDVLGEC